MPRLDAFYGPQARAAYLSVRPGITDLWGQVSDEGRSSAQRRGQLDTDHVRTKAVGRPSDPLAQLDVSAGMFVLGGRASH
jgi:hypothetical protein